MYEEFFNFSGSPFRLAPDPKFFFGSKSHNKAMAYLHYGLRQAEGFIVITGEIGAGKSILIGHLLDQLDRSNVLAANLVTPNLSPEDLLAHILSAFRIEASGTGKTAEIEAFEDFLFDQMNHGRRVLLVVDEAQNLPAKTLEELRVLSNLEYAGTPLFQVFLVGQPNFRDTMARADMEQLRQRVIASYHLEPMSRAETEKYIEHRLGFVGWDGDPKFSKDAYDAIYAATGGVPRKIHKLCNRALLFCSVEKLHQADGATIAVVLADMSAEQSGGPPAEREAAKAEFNVQAAIDAANGAGPTPEIAEPASPEVEETLCEPLMAEAAAANESLEAPSKTAPEVASAPEPALEERAPASAPVAEPALAPAAATSVFDRLRAERKRLKSENEERAPAAAGEPEARDAFPVDADPDTSRPPKSATLDDVASAIAAARSQKEAAEGAEFDANGAEMAVDAPPAADGLAQASPIVVEAEGWRKSVVMSINETREELKRAHQSVGKLRRQLTEIDRRRRKRRVQIAASLDRAESLLAEFQNAWR